MMNGTVPNWETASAGDVVEVASGSFATGQDVDIASCFSSSYKFYKLFAGGWSLVSSSSEYVQVQFLDTSGSAMTGTYNSQIRGLYGLGTSPGWGASLASDWSGNATTGFRMSDQWNNDEPRWGQTLEMFFYDPQSGRKEIVTWIATSARYNEVYPTMHYGMGMYMATTNAGGLRFKSSGSSGWVAQGHFSVVAW